MKYSNIIGIIAALVLIGACFMPWSTVPGLNITLNGINGVVSERVDFGVQIIPHTFFCVLMIIFFALPQIWAKRANVITAAIHLAWAIKNFYIFTACRIGECPEKHLAIYLVLFCAIVMMIMSLLPKVELKPED